MLLNMCLKNNITTENSYRNIMAPVNFATSPRQSYGTTDEFPDVINVKNVRGPHPQV